MPIYAYRCASCGHAQDMLQKISDPVLTVCPACGAPTFQKQVTAAGFQLKGSGWYVTDFRGGQGGAAAKPGDKAEGGSSADAPAAGGDAKPAAAPSAAPAASPADKPASSPAPAATPAAAPPAPRGGS